MRRVTCYFRIYCSKARTKNKERENVIDTAFNVVEDDYCGIKASTIICVAQTSIDLVRVSNCV